MKTLIIISVCFFNQHFYAQNTDNSTITQLVYDFNFKVFEDEENVQNEKMLLSIDRMRTSFMTESQYKLDSIFFITNKPAPTVEEEFDLLIDMQKSKNPYRIYSENKSILYRRSLNQNHYIYQEDINLKWELLPGNKEVLGYSCKKAKMEYAGRVWYAWYTYEIPLNAGPYKFKGLPGLILEIYDEELIFNFKAISLKQVSFKDYDPVKLIENGQVVENIDSKKFIKLLEKFDGLSIVEKFSFGMNQKVKVQSANGEDISRRVNQRPTKKRLYIEDF